MVPSLSREFLLAAACSIWPPSDRRKENIQRAAQAPLDWDRFLRIVARQGVVGLVHQGITSSHVAVPPAIVQEISDRAAALVRRNLALTAEAVRLQRLFNEAKLPILFLKGASLAILAYGNLGLRESKDVDLFVPPSSLSAATDLIQRAGYRRLEPPAEASDRQMQLLLTLRKDLVYVNDVSQATIELHWRLLSNPHFMDETNVMLSSRVVPIGGTVGLRTLGDNDLFAYLCAHGAQHWWYQLKWLADVGALLSATPDCGARLYRVAHTKGVGKAAVQAIGLCHRLLEATMPDQLVTCTNKKASASWLETTALKAMTARNGEIDPHELLFGTTRGSVSCFLLSRNWRYWLAELKIHFICQADVLILDLPRYLHFLYPVLRLPLWLWRHGIQRIRWAGK